MTAVQTDPTETEQPAPWRFSGVDAVTGRAVSGYEVGLEQSVRRLLRAQSVIITKLRRSPRMYKVSTLLNQQFGSADPDHVARVLRALATGLKTNLTPGQALGQALVGLPAKSVVYRTVQTMHNDVEEGRFSLGAAFAEHADVFSDEVAEIVQQTEDSATLVQSLDLLASSAERQLTLRKRVMSGLRGTISQLTILTLGGLAGSMALVPLVDDAYRQIGVDDPRSVYNPIARAVGDFRVFMLEYYPLVVLGIIGLIVGIPALIRRWKRVNEALSRYMLRMPLFGEMLHGLAVCQTCGLMGLMLQAGVPHLKVLRTAAHSVRYREFKDSLSSAAENMAVSGWDFSDAVAEACPPLPDSCQLFAKQVQAGASDPGAQWLSLAERTSEDLNDMASKLEVRVKPLMLVVALLVVLVFAATLYVPLLSLGSHIQT